MLVANSCEGAARERANCGAWLVLLPLELLHVDPVDRLQFAKAFRRVDDVGDALVDAQPREWQPTVVETPK